MNIDEITAIWSGTVLQWALLDMDGSPANFIHCCFSHEFWHESDKLKQVKQCLAFLLKPMTVVLLTAFFTSYNGRAIKARTGKALLRQACEQIQVAMFYGILPPWYYIFELYYDERRRKARDYLNRFETKRFVYKFLRKYLSGPTGVTSRSMDALSNKALFARRCRAHGLSAVPALMVVERGEVLPADGAHAALPKIDLFLKPLHGAGGRGAERWDYQGGGHYKDPAGNLLSGAGLLAHMKSLSRDESYVLRPRVVNHPDIADLSNGALSTVRVITCRNEHGEYEVAVAAFRMAQGSNQVTDNFHTGGIIAPVDILSGKLGRGIDGGKLGRGGRHYETHPDTGAAILGRQLPAWAEALDLVRRAHALAFADRIVIGWDVALLADGPHLVEGNKGPCTDIMQRAHGGPLGNSRLGELLAFNLQRALEAKYGALGPAKRWWRLPPVPPGLSTLGHS